MIYLNTYEYCAIKTDLDGDKETKLKFFDAKGEHKGSKITDVNRKIAELGIEGWELVTLVQLTDPKARVYYFKRIKE